MKNLYAKFTIGQIIHHKLLGYRGVVADVDATYQGYSQLLEKESNPTQKNIPWYHVLIDGTNNISYVAEKNLEPDQNTDPVYHPELDYFFSGYRNGKYLPRRATN